MLKISNLKLSYHSSSLGSIQAVKGVSFEMGQGEFYTLLGPSGCGKTSTLRSVAGLENPDSGEITIGEALVYSSSSNISIPSYKRDCAMVFQSYAIWPHMTVLENVAIPLRKGRPGLGKNEAEDKAINALDMVRLSEYANRPAPYLSGGEQQRVALARALALEPKLLLLDEPLSNLDAKLREATRRELKQLVSRLNITSLYVTHDQIEALALSDKIAVMQDGIIVQEGTPSDVYASPNSGYVADFLGNPNKIDVSVSTTDKDHNSATALLPDGSSIICFSSGAKEKGKYNLIMRPEHLEISARPRKIVNAFNANVINVTFLGEMTEYEIEMGGSKLITKRLGSPIAKIGERIVITIDPKYCLLLPHSKN
ncbi:MAG: ABC transporter ATP-binding protein [SAR202 cluster bacterium]|nr:ABC transporter ATP-binding protein [SAR202 cluster bacterium]|tara:strand:- start:8335 stop:9441 length:1107 start_codon:yes stop_codon:yes gene_type:complete